MKTLALIVLLFALPASSSFAHPGHTDRYGGHRCLKDCDEWKLYFEEYHLHDKYGRPIRVAKQPKKHVAPRAALTAPTPTVEPAVSSAPVVTTTVTVYRTIPIEESILTNPLLYVLLLLLILLLVIRMNRKREGS